MFFLGNDEGFISISVVQKILETCTDEHCAILLDHIKVDLQALEKVAYKKHMVAWAERSCGEGMWLQALVVNFEKVPLIKDIYYMQI